MSIIIPTTVITATAAISTKATRVHAAVAKRPETFVTAVMSVSYMGAAVDHIEVSVVIMAFAYVVEAVITAHREGREHHEA